MRSIFRFLQKQIKINVVLVRLVPICRILISVELGVKLVFREEREQENGWHSGAACVWRRRSGLYSATVHFFFLFFDSSISPSSCGTVTTNSLYFRLIFKFRDIFLFDCWSPLQLVQYWYFQDKWNWNEMNCFSSMISLFLFFLVFWGFWVLLILGKWFMLH